MIGVVITTNVELREALELATSCSGTLKRITEDSGQLCRSKAPPFPSQPSPHRSSRHTRRHPAIPHPASRDTALQRPVRSEWSTPHAKLSGLGKFTITTETRNPIPTRHIRPRCLPKFPTSSSSSRSAGARMLSVRLTTIRGDRMSQEEEALGQQGRMRWTKKDTRAMRIGN